MSHTTPDPDPQFAVLASAPLWRWAEPPLADPAYRSLEVNLTGVPLHFQAFGFEWVSQPSHHISIFTPKHCIADLQAAHGISEGVAASVIEIAVEAADLQLPRTVHVTSELRLVQRDDRRSLVAMCEIPELAEMYRLLNQRLPIEIEAPPAHITLATADGGKGIGLVNQLQLQQLSQPVVSVVSPSLVALTNKA